MDSQTYEVKEKAWAKSGVAYYKAQIIEKNDSKIPIQYKVHYERFSKRYDEWITADKLMKLSKENNALANKIFKDALKKEKEQETLENARIQEKIKKKEEDENEKRKGATSNKKKKGFKKIFIISFSVKICYF